MLHDLLLPSTPSLRLDSINIGPDMISLTVTATALQVQCPRCAQATTAIQSHLNQRKYKGRAYTLEQIHLAQRGNAAKALGDVTLQGEDGALTLTLQVNAERLAQTQQRDGRYPLVTNRWALRASEGLPRFKQQDLCVH